VVGRKGWNVDNGWKGWWRKAGKRQVPVGQREGREREWNNGMLANRGVLFRLSGKVE
jgi:hypothetical protein